MCGPGEQFTNVPATTGNPDESTRCNVTERGQRALAAWHLAAAERSSRRRALARALRAEGRRCGTVYSRWRIDRCVSEVSLSYVWLRPWADVRGRG